MERETKNIITRSSVEKELRSCNTANLRISLILNSVLLPPYILLIVGIVYGIFMCINDLVLDIIISAVLVVGLAVFPFNIIRPLGFIISEKRLLDRGEFDIITADVTKKKKENCIAPRSKDPCFFRF